MYLTTDLLPSHRTRSGNSLPAHEKGSGNASLLLRASHLGGFLPWQPSSLT